MKFIMANDGASYTPAGHDADVVSRSIYKDKLDIHSTTFPAGAGMEEEVHEHASHVFLIFEGELEVLQNKQLLKVLKTGDAVYIPAGEWHEIKNSTDQKAVFLAITFPE